VAYDVDGAHMVLHRAAPCCTVLTLPIFNKVGNGKWARAALPHSEAGTRAFVSDAKDGASLAQLVDHFECPLQFR